LIEYVGLQLPLELRKLIFLELLVLELGLL